MAVQNIETTALLSTAYLGPVQYYCKIIQYNQIFIERFEHYSKQSFRNRCIILSANGPLCLSIPVKKSHNTKMFTKDIQLDNDKRWKAVHIRAIEAAYRSSPFFLYYSDELINVYKKKIDFLIDFNNELQQIILELLNIKVRINFTSDFKAIPYPFDDFADAIHPKTRMQKPDNNFVPKSYYQVMKHGLDLFQT